MPETLLASDGRGSRRPYPSTSCLDALFLDQARRRTEATVIVDGTASLTYGQLANRSGHLAELLVSQGVKTGDVVGVCTLSAIHRLTAVLAVLRAGGIYLPIDSRNARSRIDYMLDDAGVALTVCDHAFHRRTIDLDCIDWEAPDNVRPDTPCPRAATDTAFVMYTSGSTGRPKGVAICHRAVARLVVNSDYVKFSGFDRIALLANDSFDASTFELWGALLNGGCLVSADKGALLTPFELEEFINNNGITIMFLTPAVFHLHAQHAPHMFSPLTYLVVGGDVLDPRAVAAVAKGGPPGHLINGYGPTECTTFALAHEVAPTDGELPAIPIGKPIANTDAYLLGADGRPVSDGEIGEIHLAGDGLAVGYLNDAGLTGERFPYIDGVRMYRTGDAARWRDGTIEFLGRLDDQVKIRGFRVEPGEVEAAVRSVPGVREAAVITLGAEATGPLLIAFVAPHDVTLAERVAHTLAQALPDYLRPHRVLTMPALPLTPNGKTDRRALRAAIESSEGTP